MSAALPTLLLDSETGIFPFSLIFNLGLPFGVNVDFSIFSCGANTSSIL